MKIISWNCRGLGNPRAIRALLRLKNLENPHMVFLMETKLTEIEMNKVKQQCGYSSGFVVGCRGSGKDRAGGIALLWGDLIKFSVLSFSLNHIHGTGFLDESDVPCLVTGIYSYPDSHKKDTWLLIQSLFDPVYNDWLCFGDLNDTISADEKLGGNSRSFDQLSLRRDTITSCGFNDLGFLGYPYTWSNGREGTENIQCRLDRALGSEGFCNRFAPIRVFHLPICFESDAESVVKGVAGCVVDYSIANIILDCNSLLNSLLNSRIVYVSRNCNRAAHALVGMAKVLGSVMWRGYVPEPCLSVTCEDALGSGSSLLIE